MAYYVDSCIYLNLWQKEVSPAGQPLWKFALDFFEHVEKKREPILFSGFVLKELAFVFGEEFAKKKCLFQNKARFQRIVAFQEDYGAARKLESAAQFTLSFFDCMHIVLAKKTSATLVTRDRTLIDIARAYCRVARPEEAVSTD